jgi:hypothetical protein
MSAETATARQPATTFPRSSATGPNLATLDQFRAARRRRMRPLQTLRRPIHGERVAC